MPAEQTLVIMKPDCVERGLVGECLKRFEDAGLRITETFYLYSPKKDLLIRHYRHLDDDISQLTPT